MEIAIAVVFLAIFVGIGILLLGIIGFLLIRRRRRKSAALK